MCWKPTRRSNFEDTGYYQVCIVLRIIHSLQKEYGSQRSLLELLFFVWTTNLGKILMINNLQKVKVRILDWCYLCKSNRETIDHLRIHSPIANKLWSMVFGLFGVHWVMPKTVVDLLPSSSFLLFSFFFEKLTCRQGRFAHYRKGVIWMVVPHCLMWNVWREGYNQSFEDS